MDTDGNVSGRLDVEEGVKFAPEPPYRGPVILPPRVTSKAMPR